MKTKNGFTTNSSSSSFILLSKTHDIIELKQALKKIAGDTPLFPNLADDVASLFLNNLEEVTLKEYLLGLGYDNVKEAREEGDSFIEKLLENEAQYPYIFEGSFTDETDDGIEVMLCFADIDYKDEKIVIHKEGGY